MDKREHELAFKNLKNIVKVDTDHQLPRVRITDKCKGCKYDPESKSIFATCPCDFILEHIGHDMLKVQMYDNDTGKKVDCQRFKVKLIRYWDVGYGAFPKLTAFDFSDVEKEIQKAKESGRLNDLVIYTDYMTQDEYDGIMKNKGE